MNGNLLTSTSCELEHAPSNSKIKTTAPIDNGGDGSTFSPTDLCAVSLGACASTIIGMFAQKNSIPLEEVYFEVEKEMSANPRRISKLKLLLRLKTSCSEQDFKRLENAGRTCPVRLSLNPAIEIDESYERVY